MASIYQLKSAFQGLLRPFTRLLARCGLTANAVTLFALLLSTATGAALFHFRDESWPLFLVPAALFLRMALNAIDGMLAREHDMKTPLGAILNELGDVLSDIALYLPFAFLPVISNWDRLLVYPIVLVAILTEMTGVIGVQIGASRRYDGPMGKSDRAFVFGAVALILGFGVPAQPWLTWVLGAILLLSVVTVANRGRKAIRELAQQPRESA